MSSRGLIRGFGAVFTILWMVPSVAPAGETVVLNRWADEGALIPDAIQELLRLEPSFVSVGRTAVRDTELAGQSIKTGDKVLIHWASANRDGGEFADPDAFDLGRERNRHLSFGVGPHRCLGSNLARMNMRVALEELLRRLEDSAWPALRLGKPRRRAGWRWAAPPSPW